ncbi:MAG: peptide ABC transporter substrate-binding protein [Oscillospiraceae bacterium]
MKKTLSLLLALSLSVFTFTGCKNETSAPQTSEKQEDKASVSQEETAAQKEFGVLNLYQGDDLETLNNHTYKISSTREFIMLVGGTLYRMTPSKEHAFVLVPEYAEGEPEMLDTEGLVWKIKVKDGMKWQNGDPLTAEDFEYSYKMMLDPLLLNHRAFVFEESNIFIKNAHPYFEQASTGAKMEWSEVGIKAKEDNSLELTLTKPANAASIMNCMSGSTSVPVYKKYYEGGMSAEKTETNYGTDMTKFMASGPYIMTEWSKGSSYKARRNPNYPLYDDISLEGIDYIVVSESGTAMQLFEKGELDYIRLSSSAAEQYGEDPRVMEVPAPSVTCLGLNAINTNKKVLQNPKFRQALRFGANREELASLVKGMPATYYITNDYIADLLTGMPYRESDEAKAALPENYGYDPEKAKTLFNEALAEAGVDKVELEIIYQDGANSRKAASEYVQQAYPQLFGADKLSIKLQAVPASQLSEKLRDHINNPNSFEMGWIASKYNLMDPSSALMEWEKNATRKKIPYYDDEFTAIYDEIKNLPVDASAERTSLTAKAEKKMLDDACVIPLYCDVTRVLINDRVELPIGQYNNVTEFAWAWAKIKNK